MFVKKLWVIKLRLSKNLLALSESYQYQQDITIVKIQRELYYQSTDRRFVKTVKRKNKNIDFFFTQWALMIIYLVKINNIFIIDYVFKYLLIWYWWLFNILMYVTNVSISEGLYYLIKESE